MIRPQTAADPVFVISRNAENQGIIGLSLRDVNGPGSFYWTINTNFSINEVCQLKKYMILFLVGKDRPGIVDDVATLLFRAGANIEDSRMAVMGGCFSIMTLFSCTDEQLKDIRADMKSLEDLGLETFLHKAEDPSAIPKRAELPLKIELTAMDHPGIVQKVVNTLRQHDINIQSMNTEITRAPLSGAPMFELNLEAAVPAEKPIAKVKDEISRLAAEMNLDLHFK